MRRSFKRKSNLVDRFEEAKLEFITRQTGRDDGQDIAGKICISFDSDYRSFTKGTNLELDGSTCLIGQNGSGKSTLLQMLVWEVYERGDRTIDRAHWSHHFLAYEKPVQVSGIGSRRFLEYFSMYSDARTKKGNLGMLDLLSYVNGSSSSSGEHRYNSVIELLSKPIEYKSEPLLVVLDEPETNLDLVGLNIVSWAIQGLIKAGHTVICSTHSTVIMKAFDNILLMPSGQKVSVSDYIEFMGGISKDIIDKKLKRKNKK